MNNLSIPKQLKELEKKFGITAYNEFLNILSRMHMKIEELTKSRNNWRAKYENLVSLSK